MVLFSLLWLSNIVWSLVLWYLHALVCFCSVLPWLFVVFCASKWTLGRFFNLCVECHWNIGGKCKEELFDVLLSYWYHFYFFPLLIDLPTNSSTILRNKGVRGLCFLFPDFRGNGFSFLPFSKMLAVVLSYIAFIMLRYVVSILSFFRAFIRKRC
jgi:hypothetical protein